MGFRRITATDVAILQHGGKYPKSGAKIGAQRAFFRLADGLTAEDIANGVRIFFGSEDTDGILTVGTDHESRTTRGDCYTIDGKKNRRTAHTQGPVYPEWPQGRD